jgi:hypothetical protein
LFQQIWYKINKIKLNKKKDLLKAKQPNHAKDSNIHWNTVRNLGLNKSMGVGEAREAINIFWGRVGEHNTKNPTFTMMMSVVMS